MNLGSDEGKQHPGLPQEEHIQQIKESDYSPSVGTLFMLQLEYDVQSSGGYQSGGIGTCVLWEDAVGLGLVHLEVMASVAPDSNPVTDGRGTGDATRLFTVMCGRRARGCGQKLKYERLRLDIRKKHS